MKKFKYSLENVLHYKKQVLDNLKTEHAVLITQVNRKEQEIHTLEGKLFSYQDKADQMKRQQVCIRDIRLYNQCIDGIEFEIQKEREKLVQLQRQEEDKKKQVVSANIDTSRYEKLKDRRMEEYRKAAAKAQELFIEEYTARVSRHPRHVREVAG